MIFGLMKEPKAKVTTFPPVIEATTAFVAVLITETVPTGERCHRLLILLFANINKLSVRGD